MSFNEPKKRQQGFALPTPSTSSAHTSHANGSPDQSKARSPAPHASSYIDTGLLMDDDSVWGSLSRPSHTHAVMSASEPGPFTKLGHGMQSQHSAMSELDNNTDRDMEDVIMIGAQDSAREGADGQEAPFSLDAFHNLNAWVSFSPLPTSSEPANAASDANKTLGEGFFLPGMLGTPEHTGDDTSGARKPSVSSLGASSPLTTGSISTGPPSTGDGASVASDFTQATSVHSSSPVFPNLKPDMKKMSSSSLKVAARDGKPRPRSATTTATPTESISAVLESSRMGRPTDQSGLRPSGVRRNPSSSGLRQGDKRRSPSNDRGAAVTSAAASRTGEDGGVGKAPRSRSRPTRRNSTGPAARLGSKDSPPHGQRDALRIDTSTEATGGAADRSASFGGIPIPWTASPWPAGYQWPHFAAPGSHPHGAPAHGWSQWPPQGYPHPGTSWAAPGHPSMPMPFPYPGPQGWPFPPPGVGTTPGGEPLGSPGFHPQSLPSSMPAMFGNMNLQVSAQSPAVPRPNWFPEPSGAAATASSDSTGTGLNGTQQAQRESSSERSGPSASMSPPTRDLKKEDAETPSLAEMRTPGETPNSNHIRSDSGGESKRSPPRTWPENKVRRASRSLGRVSGRILEDVPETEAVHATSHDSPFASSNSDASPSTNALSSSLSSSSRLKKVVDGNKKDDVANDRKDANGDDEEMETLEGEGEEGEDASDVEDDDEQSSAAPSAATAAAKKKASAASAPTATTTSPTGRRVKSESEKRKKRRESHNLVERRRRDTINERIAELASLLPESMLLDAIAHSQSGGNNSKVVKVPMPEGCLAKLAHGKCSVEEAALDALASAPANSETLAAAQARPNKGIILRKSVDYIRALQDFIEQQASHNRMLQAELARHQEQAGHAPAQQSSHAASSSSTQQRLWPHETTENLSWPLGNLASTFDLSELDMDAFRKMVAEHEGANGQQRQNNTAGDDERGVRPAAHGANGKHAAAGDDEAPPNQGAFFTHLDMMHRVSAKANDDSKLGVPSSSRTHSRSHSYAGSGSASANGAGSFGGMVPPPSLGDWLASAAGLAHANSVQAHERGAGAGAGASMSMGMGLGGGLSMGMGMGMGANTSVDMGPGMNSLGSLGSFCGGFNGARSDTAAPMQGQHEHAQASDEVKQQQQQGADTMAAAAA